MRAGRYRLKTPTDEEEDSVLGDFIEDEEAPAPAETATYNLLKEHLESILKDLPPREVRILQLRYGLLDGQAYTLEEVGRKMGVTRERVRQIEAQALTRLRHPQIRKILRDYQYIFNYSNVDLVRKNDDERVHPLS